MNVIQEYAKTACNKILSCGHPCRGIKDEDPCLPCLHRCGKEETLKQDADDMCMICFTEALSAAPAIQVNDWSSQMKVFQFDCILCLHLFLSMSVVMDMHKLRCLLTIGTHGFDTFDDFLCLLLCTIIDCLVEMKTMNISI